MNSPGQESADSKPSWQGTRRYGFRPAPPGGLALVQDFLNTREHADKGPDLLGDAEHANAWAANAIRNWSALRGTQPPLLVLTDDDAARLRELRDFLDMVLTGSRSHAATARPRYSGNRAGRRRGDVVDANWTRMVLVGVGDHG